MCAVGFGSGDKNEHTGVQEVYLPLINRGLAVGVIVRGAMVETSSEDLAMFHAGARLRGIGSRSGVQVPHSTFSL